MAKPFLSVVIPAYNEEARLPTTLIAMDKHLSTREYSYEILIVNAASSDKTREISEKFATTLKNVRVMHMQKSLGKGDAVKQGMLEARGNYRLFTDADNSTSVDHFDAMLPFFKEGYEVVICSRQMKGSKLIPPQPWYKQLLGRFGNLYIQALVLPGLWDTQCGFKAFTEDAAKAIFPLIRIDRWGFDVEVLALAKRLGYRIKQIPVTWINDINSHVTLGGYFNTLFEVLKISFYLWRNVYKLPPRS